jgi:hypothetical protein
LTGEQIECVVADLAFKLRFPMGHHMVLVRLQVPLVPAVEVPASSFSVLVPLES